MGPGDEGVAAGCDSGRMCLWNRRTGAAQAGTGSLLGEHRPGTASCRLVWVLGRAATSGRVQSPAVIAMLCAVAASA